MSIATLNQVYDEVRRLAIAGSSLASGDFRLKKLIAPLQQAGKKAPVFAKVAEATEKLVDSKEKESSRALLELSTLVSAILYTQGKTGAEGKLKTLETIELGTPTTGTSARVLKPLIEALTTTGSGRWEIINDAYSRGAFRDMRLVLPALSAIDDSCGEIAELVTNRILPLYGKSIFPYLQERWTAKGRGGHLRRLRLMHQIDPKATHPLVLDALENGSREMKIVALECLDGTPEGLSHLLTHIDAKSKDVRRAALRGMAQYKNEEVVEALQKALAGKDLELAVEPASLNPSPQLLKFLLNSAAEQRDAILNGKDAKQRVKLLERLNRFLHCFEGRSDKKTVKFLIDLFDRRQELLQAKGVEVVRTTSHLLLFGKDKSALESLADSHHLGADEWLFSCLTAAALVWPSAKVYEFFSPYLSNRNASGQKREKARTRQQRRKVIAAVLECIMRAPEDSTSAIHLNLDHDRVRELTAGVTLDPRWLDSGIEADHLDTVRATARPEHKACEDYLADKFRKSLSTANAWNTVGILDILIRVQHPDLVPLTITALKKHLKGSSRLYMVYYFGDRILELPPEAVEPLENLVASLSGRVADELVPYIAELKSKTQ